MLNSRFPYKIYTHNRDKEQLVQINICMLMGEKSRLPIYQTLYSGSLKDVSTIKTTLSKMDSISEGKPILIVMDKGFYSTRNINSMLNKECNIRFIITVPFTSNFARKQIESECKDIDCLQNTIVNSGDSIRGVTKLGSWDKEHKIYTHIYFNAIKVMTLREELYSHVTVLKEQAEADTVKAMGNDDYEKYLLIRNSEKSPTGYTVNIKYDIVTRELETAGWMVIINNDVSDAKEAISIYCEKHVVEKGFLCLKNSLDIGGLRVHIVDSIHWNVKQINRMQHKGHILIIRLVLTVLLRVNVHS